MLFRLNFLGVCLALAMNHPYSFYYFVPLCTFWFLLVYAVMLLLARHNKSPVFLLAKIMGFFVFSAVLYQTSTPIFETVFETWPLVEVSLARVSLFPLSLVLLRLLLIRPRSVCSPWGFVWIDLWRKWVGARVAVPLWTRQVHRAVRDVGRLPLHAPVIPRWHRRVLCGLTRPSYVRCYA